MKKRGFSALLTLAVVSVAIGATGCGEKKDATTAATTAASEQEATKESEATTEATTDATTEATTDATTDATTEATTETTTEAAAGKLSANIKLHSLETAEKAKIEDVDEEFAYAYANFSEIVISDDTAKNYPKLGISIDNLNELEYSSLMENFADCANYATTDESEGYLYGPNAIEMTESISRFDDNATSVLIFYFMNAGGAHPNSWYRSCNYDSKTGEEIKITDVVNDPDTLVEKIIDHLDFDAVDGEEEEELITDLKENGVMGITPLNEQLKNEIDDGTLVWILDENGISTYYAAYDLAPYAYGPLTSHLTLEDYPDLLKDEYKIPENTVPVAERVTEEKLEKEEFTLEDLEQYAKPADN